VSAGTLVAEDGTWRLATSPDEISLPATVQAIYAAQLDDLPDAPRRAARRASVSGRRVPLGALPALDITDASDAVEVLLRRDIVAATEPDPIGGDAVAFRHALLRDVGYASLARAERALLHLRLARWLEQAAGDAADIVAAAIAAHWELAVTSAPALAPEIGDGVSRADARREAAMWLERGAVVARRIAAHEGAADLLHRALAVTDDDQVLDRARRLVALADAEAFQSSELARDGYAAAVDLLTPLVRPTAATIRPGSRMATRSCASAGSTSTASSSMPPTSPPPSPSRSSVRARMRRGCASTSSAAVRRRR
jgi:predicted ATPase